MWAQTDEGVRGFLVPTGTPGFAVRVLEPKGSMRASVQTELTFDDVRLPAEAMLEGARGLRGPFSALNEARYGIVWGALGACYLAAFLGPLLGLPDWVMDLSPFTHVPLLPAADMDWVSLLLLSAVALAL